MMNIFIDPEGIICQKDRLVDGAIGFLNALCSDGCNIFFLPILSQTTKHSLEQLLADGGFSVDPSQIITPADITALICKANNIQSPFVLGTQDFRQELSQNGIHSLTYEDHQKVEAHKMELMNEIDAVIVAHDPLYSHERASLGVRYVREKKVPLFTVEGGHSFCFGGHYVPTSNSLAAMIKTAAMIDPILIGRPSVNAFKLHPHSSKLEGALFIGTQDELDTPFASEMHCNYIKFENFQEIVEQIELKKNSLR